MHVRDMYVAGTVLGMASTGRTDGRTRRAISPPRLEPLLRLNSVKPRTGENVFAYWAPRILPEDEGSALRARRHREVWRWVVVRKLKLRRNKILN